MSEVLGKIKVINVEQQVTTTFKKRELVVTTNEQYPQHISINFVQDKCDLLNGYKVGDDVKVGINLRGKEYVNQQGETKYFNDIQGWKIEKAEAVAEAPKDEKYKGKKEYTEPLAQEYEDEILPF